MEGTRGKQETSKSGYVAVALQLAEIRYRNVEMRSHSVITSRFLSRTSRMSG